MLDEAAAAAGVERVVLTSLLAAVAYGHDEVGSRKLMKRGLPGCPNVGWAPVDVRDVAEMHVTAMTLPEAEGKRFCRGGAIAFPRGVCLTSW